MKNKVKAYDAIVVGGGMAGLGVAVRLGERRKKVLLVSRIQPGASTPAAGGILDPFLEMTPHHPLFKLCREAYFEYPRKIQLLKKKTGTDPGYKKMGMLFVALDASHVRELKHRLAWQRKTGIPVRWMDKKEILRKYPGVNPNLLGGLFYPTIARVNPVFFAKTLRRYAEKLGVQILEAASLSRIVIQKGKAVGVTVKGRDYSAPAIVNATGSWAGSAHSFSKKLPVHPVRGQILLMRGTKKISTILHSLDGGYIVPWGGNDYVAGSTVEFAGYDPKVTAAGCKAIAAKNSRIYPGLSRFKQVGSWAGLRPYSTKKIPLIGPSKIPGLYLAAGYYRSGILIGLHAGKLLADAILSRKVPKQLKPFDPRKYSL